MKNDKCEVCGGDGSFKLKDGTITGYFRVLNETKNGKKLDLRDKKNFRLRCIRCNYSNKIISNVEYAKEKGETQ